MTKSDEKVTEEKDCKPPKYCRPLLKGALLRRSRVVLGGAIATAILAGFAHYVFVGAPRKKRYAEFYK